VIGPQWIYSFCIALIASVFSAINIGMSVQMIELSVSIWLLSITWILVLIGIFCVFYTFLANPGIPDELFTSQPSFLNLSD